MKSSPIDSSSTAKRTDTTEERVALSKTFFLIFVVGIISIDVIQEWKRTDNRQYGASSWGSDAHQAVKEGI